MHSGPASRALGLLEEAVGALAAEDVGTLADGALRENIVGVRRVINQLEAQLCRNVRVFDKRRSFAADLAVSMVSWLRARCHLTGAAAASRVEVARKLDELPAAAAAFIAGDLGLQQAVAITQLIDDVGVDLVRVNEQLILDGATKFDAGWVRSLGRHLREVCDAAGALDEANRRHELRRLHVSPTLDGVVYIEGRLDGDDGAVVMTALDSLMSPVAGDSRKASQRRADALVELCRRQLDAGELPQRGGQRPHVSLTVSVERLRGDREAPAAELEWIGPIPTETARRLMCDASITSVVVDAAGLPLAISHEGPGVPPHIRRALILRDAGCVCCGRPPQWCDAHHIVHRANGGETKLANLGLLCRLHHRAVHEGGLSIRHTPDGGIEVLGRDGRVVAGAPLPRRGLPPIRAA